MSEVDYTKYPNAMQKYRFEKVEASYQAEGLENESATNTIEESEVSALNVDDNETQKQTDPALLAFLDADTLEEKYNVLVSVQGRITDYLIDSFAVCLDVVIPEGEVDTRYRQLLSSIRTMQKYESNRLR